MGREGGVGTGYKACAGKARRMAWRPAQHCKRRYTRQAQRHLHVLVLSSAWAPAAVEQKKRQHPQRAQIVVKAGCGRTSLHRISDGSAGCETAVFGRWDCLCFHRLWVWLLTLRLLLLWLLALLMLLRLLATVLLLVCPVTLFLLHDADKRIWRSSWSINLFGISDVSAGLLSYTAIHPLHSTTLEVAPS